MRTARTCCVLTIALCMLSPVQATAAKAPLQPVDKWVVDYAAANCSAARKYGDASKPVIFGIQPAPNGETFELLEVFPRSGPEFAEELEGFVDFGTGPIKAWLLRHAAKPNHQAVYHFRITASQMAQAQSATTVTLGGRGAASVTFALTSLPGVLNALQKCTADLQRYWNMNGEKDGKIAQPPKGDIRYIFSSDDFPAEAMKRRQEGKGQFLLLIDEKGAVAGCHVEATTGIPVLDGMSCAVLRERAKFTPARGPDGNPVRSTVVTPQIVYKIGG